MDILYTTSDEFEGAVFAERAKAESVARIYDACLTATTWGGFKSKLAPEEYAEVLENNDLDEAAIDPAGPFDAAVDVTGFADGFYPAWLHQDMLTWFPRDLVAKYGGEEALSLHNGEFLVLPADRADEIAADLVGRGHTVTRSELFFF